MRRSQFFLSSRREQSSTGEQTSQNAPQEALRSEQRTLNEQRALTDQSAPTEQRTLNEQRAPTEQRILTEHPNLNESSLTASNENAWIVGSTHSDGRVRVDVIDNILEPSNKCAHKITDIIYERLEPVGYNWKSVTNMTQDFYFEEFKKYFVWKPQLSDRVLRDAWLKSARIRYADICCSARRAWEKDGKRKNKIGEDVWMSWIQYWNSPLFQSKSEIQKRNRNSGVDGRPSTHTGGSLSHKKHAIHLAEKLKRKPTAGDVFKYTHSKNHDSKTFIDPKSKQVYDNLEAQLKELSQNVNDSAVAQPIDENKLYFDVVGGKNKKNVVYGIGSSQSIFYGPKKSHDISASRIGSQGNYNEDYEKLQAELQEMKDLVKAVKEQQQAMESRLLMIVEPRSNDDPDLPATDEDSHN